MKRTSQRHGYSVDIFCVESLHHIELTYMTARVKRFWLLLLSVLALLCGCAMITWAQFLPFDKAVVTTAKSPLKNGGANTVTSTESGIKLDHACWQLALTREKLSEPVSLDPVEVDEPMDETYDKPTPSLDFELLGIVTENGRSQAIVSDATKQIDVRGNGEELALEPNGAVIKDISADEVVISFDGDEHSLVLDN